MHEYGFYSIYISILLVFAALWFPHLLLTSVKAEHLGVESDQISQFLAQKQQVLREYPGCRQTLYTRSAAEQESDITGQKRIIAIGDIHGAHDGFKELLQHANLITGNECKWNPKVKDDPVIFVQMGDIVDRGPHAFEAYKCLQNLQRTASEVNSEVVRLIGNHELWWLTGVLNYKNRIEDTPDKVKYIIDQMHQEIIEGNVKGAHYLDHASGLPLLFIHGGIRPTMYDYLTEKGYISESDSDKNVAHSIAGHVNSKLQKDIKNCVGLIKAKKTNTCRLNDLIYSAGPERGGNQIGGTYWTDFHVLQDSASRQLMEEITSTSSSGHIHGPLKTEVGNEAPVKELSAVARTGIPSFLQIVGHTVEVNEIRTLPGLSATCVDAGMMYRGRAYLEITKEGRFISHTQEMDGGNAGMMGRLQSQFMGKAKGQWIREDLTQRACS
jgi:hypothetical protein